VDEPLSSDYIKKLHQILKESTSDTSSQEYYEIGKERLLETFGASQDSYKTFLKEMRYIE